jgi:hypothetical protein
MGKSIPTKSHHPIDVRKQLHVVSQSQPQRFQAITFPHPVESGIRTARAGCSSALGLPGEDQFEEAGTSELALSLETILDPLYSAKSGREAVCAILRWVVLLRDSRRISTNHSLTVEPCPNEVILSCESFVRERRQILRAQFLRRLEESVFEGELPEDANVEALATLCVSFLIGLAVSTRDELPTSCVLNSVALFVDGLGFHTIRSTRRRDRGRRARTRVG